MTTYRLLANLVAAVHAGFVLFVVAGLVVILLGAALRWSWARNFWFRTIHLAVILIVGLEALTHFDCPLTTLEKWLREQAGEAAYEGDFLVHCLHDVILFPDWPLWVFPILHTGFAALVAVVFLLIPPRWPRLNSPR